MFELFKHPLSLFTTHAKNWYVRFERPISSLSLVGGFIFNAVALTRVDEFKENFWIAVHLLVVAACMVFINREENHEGDALALGANPDKLHFWLINIMQFMFGGLLSTFLVFYFRSAVLSVAWPFLLILVVAFIANESLKRHYARLYFQVSFLFLSVFLFAIYFVPVLVKDISSVIFLISGIASLVCILLFLLLLRYTGGESLGRDRIVLFSLIAGIFVGMNALYFLHLIPPLPLSLQDAGVYHSIVRTAEGDYVVTTEQKTFPDKVKQIVGMYPTYHSFDAKPVYVFTSIFSPEDFHLMVVHEWQKYDEIKKTWVTYGTITLPVTGGRAGGFRTYSAKSGVTAGKWRVNVKTVSGQVLGRMVFTVETVDSAPQLQTEVKE
jgi:hypothetical protein